MKFRARSRQTRQGKMNRGGFKQPSIYSRTQQDPEKRDYKKGVLGFILVILILIAVYILFFSSLFRINKVELNQIRYQDKTAIDKTIFDYKNKFILNRNLLFISSGTLKKKLLSLPGVKNATVIKKYPNTLIVQVEERSPAFVWQVLDHKYLVDESGMIWAVYEDKFVDFPVVVDDKNVPTEIGKKPVPASFSHFVLGLKSDFQEITGVKYVGMEVVDTTNELKVRSGAGWYAYFDTTRNAKTELANLNRILDEVKKTKNKKLEYVDLRIEDKIFYK
ncbi:MAG: FtsQ-type POTRA domain-containing protein [Patescibacteria group bacterium]|jgi:cell division septal protein FtsQ|nr:FtsQ-type POTRA domain-containing protein [Patescibacteria group bacterium]